MATFFWHCLVLTIVFFTLLFPAEAEKQELLSETEQLVSQVTDTRNEINTLQSKYNDLVAVKDRLSEQYDVIKSHNTQLTSDLHDGDRAQEELKMTIERNNAMNR